MAWYAGAVSLSLQGQRAGAREIAYERAILVRPDAYIAWCGTS